MAGVASAAAAWPTTSSAARVMPSPLTHRNLVNRVDLRDSVRSPAMKRALPHSRDRRAPRRLRLRRRRQVRPDRLHQQGRRHLRADQRGSARRRTPASTSWPAPRGTCPSSRTTSGTATRSPVTSSPTSGPCPFPRGRRTRCGRCSRQGHASSQPSTASSRPRTKTTTRPSRPRATRSRARSKTAQGEADKFGFRICGQDPGADGPLGPGRHGTDGSALAALGRAGAVAPLRGKALAGLRDADHLHADRARAAGRAATARASAPCRAAPSASVRSRRRAPNAAPRRPPAGGARGGRSSRSSSTPAGAAAPRPWPSAPHPAACRRRRRCRLRSW